MNEPFVLWQKLLVEDSNLFPCFGCWYMTTNTKMKYKLGNTSSHLYIFNKNSDILSLAVLVFLQYAN